MINYIIHNEYNKEEIKLTKDIFNNKLFNVICILEDLKVDSFGDNDYE